MKMELFSRCLNAAQRKIRKEMEDLKDEMIFRDEEGKKERNELKGRIEKLEMRLEEYSYNKNGQNNMRQENNTRDTSSLPSTFSTFRPANKSNQSAPGNSRNVNNTSTINDNNNGIMCHCQKTAIQLADKKDGSTKGHLVYKCPDKLQGNGGCNFFLSTPDNAKSQDNTACKQSSSVFNLMDSTDHFSRAFNNEIYYLGNTSANDVICNQPAQKWTVHKDGPNKERQFYGCPKGTNPFTTPFTTRNFSESVDENNAGNCKNTDLDNFTARRARNNAWKKKKRKCGNCGKEGHTKTKCPN